MHSLLSIANNAVSHTWYRVYLKCSYYKKQMATISMDEGGDKYYDGNHFAIYKCIK